MKLLRKSYDKLFKLKNTKPPSENNPEKASDIIYNLISNNKPLMVSRFGSNELNILVNYLSIKSEKKSVLNYIKGTQFDWWWNKGVVKNFNEVAGFFPTNEKSLERFAELTMNDLKSIDVLGSWLVEEERFKSEMTSIKIHLRLLEPFWSEKPWTRVLKGKKVLVVHPFVKTIFSQYNNRENLFKNKDVLPEFKEFHLVKAIQSAGNGDGNDFKNWFEALDFMKKEIDKVDYDICLIGAGAYGMPLAAHVKRNGKQAVHLGGSLQLLFGIKGKRWESNAYGVKEWGIPYGSYSNLINEYWVRPSEEEKPLNVEIVEGACYW